MSGQSIVCERRRNSRSVDDQCGFASGSHDVGDGDAESNKPRRAFESARHDAWVDSEAAAVKKQSRPPSRTASAAEKMGTEVTRAEPSLRFGHQFFSEELAPCRTAYFKLLARATILVLILTWACLPIYWGSLSASADLTGNLETWVLDRDQARIGDSLSAAALSAPTSGPGALWWRVVNASHFPTEQDVIDAVVSERTWLAIVVNNNATDNLTQARAVGNVSYDPTSAITVYYAQARNELATGTYLLPIATSFLSNFTQNYATNSAQRFFAAIVSQNGTVNQTALSFIAQAPQTISPAVSFTVVNLRPYTTPVAQAVLLVGQIYLCIFAFIMVMAHSAARAKVEQWLTFPSYLTLRIIVPLILYIPLSLSYALVNLAFRLPFGTHFSYGAGFLAFFGYLYLGMASLGLALEAMITVLKPKFVPIFLVLLIIVNISTAALPPDLQPQLYAYGAGFQFWNMQQAIRTLLFNTYSHLPKNAGILISWILISVGTTALFTWLVRYREVRRMHREARRDAENVKGSSNGKGKGRGIDVGNGKAEKARDFDDTSSEKGKSGSTALERWEDVKVQTRSKSKSKSNTPRSSRPGSTTSRKDWSDRDRAYKEKDSYVEVDVVPTRP
ncbi:uncharacterized protein FOMMEDRAFT_159353 [Fomitiporia mediterranea MF3/22]|uniref:uncharacterized protein n=1 Tax=Fomitiporia mediterranea (strain MF3/22) TaxID=694068 RepID=UPI00044076B2|nr:uncharacterized protein FOMMEDRAFT_159353 [Fomitiporia mediterranea MF3/22]EJD00605.1 hypothetical protein FOMMEDRAFT_159353 [Fomitiporia mediterranea MF3/22]